MTQENTHHRSLIRLIEQVDTQPNGLLPPDTVPSGFPSVDRALGGGFRRRDLIVLGGDVGSGKSALGLAIALRSAGAGFPVALVSGEMDADRIMERALAIEGRATVDEIRQATLSEKARISVGAAALAIKNLNLRVHPIAAGSFEKVLAPVWSDRPALLVIDYLQLLPPPATRLTQAEANASTLRRLKSLALDHQVALLLIAQLPEHDPDRADPRPDLRDFGAVGAVKQHADTILGLYREGMYRSDRGLEGATELIIAKNRNGPTGFIDLYFYEQWMRFEDMLDPES